MKFRFALLLALLSGAAGLAHQIVWTRRLVDVLGANADTFAKVIGAFFVGLAFGAWLASRSRSSRRSFWPQVALAELAVALLALPLLFSSNLSDWVYQRASFGPLLKLLLPLLLITPPTTAMGLVIPWMLRALAHAPDFSPTHAVRLYAINTLGGVAGIAATLLFTLPAWGLFGASLAALLLNLIVAAGAMMVRGQHPKHRKAESPGGTPADSSSKPARTAGKLLALESGFLVLALEVVLQLQLSQVAINSLFSSAMVLTLVLISLAAGAWLVPTLIRHAGNERRALNFALILAALLCATQPFVFIALREGVTILPYELPALAYAWELVKLGSVALCPMLVAGGLVFPLLIRNTVAAGDTDNTRRVATLLAWNGIGGWLGAELAQAVIAPQFGLWGSIVLLGAGYGALYLIYEIRFQISAPQTGRVVNRKSTIVKALAAGCILVALGWLASTFPQATVARTERLAALQVGREGVVATLDCGPGDWRMLFNNSYTLGGSKAQFNQERQGLLPLLLHGHPKTAATLGVATGGTVAGATLHPGLERIDAVELSPLVLRFAKEFFGSYSREVFADPRVRFIQDDARWVVAREQAAYDVVVGDLFLPWRTGEGRLFTLEHFQNVRRSLKPGGVFCQWLPLFQLTRPQFDAIARTFREVFPDAFLVRGDFYCELPIIGLVGGRRFDQLDWERIESGCKTLRDSGKTTDPLVRHADGVAMMLLGPLPMLVPGPINTLGNSWLEWDTGKNILGLRTPWFIAVPSAEFFREVHNAGKSLLPETRRAAHDAGQFFLTLEIAAKLNLPATANLESQIPARMPPPLRDDSQADWRQWPCRVKPGIAASP